MFRKLIRERRCLIPANCYYEWKKMPVGKQPYCIRMADESPLFIGGMWNVWHAREAGCALHFHRSDDLPKRGISDSPRPDAGDRPPEDYARWLDPKNEKIADILAPFSAEGMVAYPVSKRVNSPRTMTRS